jgi:hypothetical protein
MIAVVLSLFLGPPSAGHVSMNLIPIGVVLLPVAFTLGEIPALVTGIAVALLAHWAPAQFLRPFWQRFLIGGVLGALIGLLWHLFGRHPLGASQSAVVPAWDLAIVTTISGLPGGILAAIFPLRSWVTPLPSGK